MSRPKPETVVISFRVPIPVFNKVEKQARKEKKKRANFVASVFTEALNAHLNTAKQTA